MSDDAKPDPVALDDDERATALADHVLAVRLGHGANCSSIGSLVDTLFASAVVTGAIFAAVCAALTTEKVTVVGETPRRTPDEGDDGAKPRGGAAAADEAPREDGRGVP